MKKSVCVVGLGPAGITAVKELREKGFDVTGYDAGKRIGGRWALDWEVSEHGAWKELHTNRARHINEFSDFPWHKQDYEYQKDVEKDRYGYYPHSTEVYHYLKAYADHFDIAESVVLDTKVLKIEKSNASNNDWIVHTENNKNKRSNIKKFNFLVVAQGRYRHGHNPVIEGPLQHFSGGEIIHGANFRSVEMADNKKVLVVGSSVSGCDIAGSIARRGNAALVHHSVRHVPYVLNHLTDSGAITDEAMFSRLIVWLTSYLPEQIGNKGLQAAIGDNFATQVTVDNSDDVAASNNNKDTSSSSSSFSLVPHPDIAKAGVTYSHNWVETLREGKFSLKPGIHWSSDNGKTVAFEDGSTGEYDLVICATGYSMDLSVLPPDVRETIEFSHPWYQQTEVALYKWTLVPNTPTMAFCGAGHLIGAPFPCFEMNARWIANVFADYATTLASPSDTTIKQTNKQTSTNNNHCLARRPSETVIAEGAAGFKKYRRETPARNYDMAIAVTESMAEEMGLAPSKLRTIWNPSELLLSYPYASYYRTDPTKNDPEKAARAQKRFQYLVNNVPVGINK